MSNKNSSIRNPIGIGIIGLQHLHPRGYIELLRQTPEMGVVALAETDEALRGRLSQESGIEGHPNGQELLDREDVDAVAIFLPHSECPDAVVRAAEAGKHILVEKPMASTSEGARRMVEAARAHDVKLTTPYLWRFHAVSQEIKRLISDGALGEIVACEGRCMAGSPWRYTENDAPWMLDPEKSGGGPMLNLGVHWIDLFRWLLEDEVTRVSGEVHALSHGLEIEDNAFALMTFRSGAVATLDISYAAPVGYPGGRDLYVSLRGTLGTVSWSPAWGEYEDELVLHTQASAYRDAPARTFRFSSRPVEGYAGAMGLEFLNAFARCIVRDEPPPVDPEDGVRAVEISEAIYRSAAEKRFVDV